MQVIVLLERTIEVSLLFDFYGELLTERQQQTIRLYYFQDLSLSEISEELNISRQGVYDHLHRAEKILHEYENKLGLVNKYRKFRNNLNDLYKYIDGVFSEKEKENMKVKKEILSRINKIKQKL
ncbi:MAG: YlxM family DNA-binding protein [Bacillota bacterium]